MVLFKISINVFLLMALFFSFNAFSQTQACKKNIKLSNGLMMTLYNPNNHIIGDTGIVINRIVKRINLNNHANQDAAKSQITCRYSIIQSIQTQDIPKQLPHYEKLKLKNGLQLYLMPQHNDDDISIKVTIGAGSVDNHLFANLALHGIKLGSNYFDKQEIKQQLLEISANLSTSVEMERSLVTLSFPKQNLNKALLLLHSLLLAPQIENSMFNHLLSKQQKQEQKYQQSPLLIAEHVFNHHVTQQVSQYNKILSKAHLNQFYQRYYQPRNMAIAIVGDINIDELKSRTSKLFKNWKNKNISIRDRYKNMEPQNNSHVILIDENKRDDVFFILGGLTVNRNHSDYAIIQVINTMLGGHFTSLLNKNIKIKQSLANKIRSDIFHYQYHGVFSISGSMHINNTQAVLDSALATYQQLANQDIDKSLLDLAKSITQTRMLSQLKNNKKLASLLITKHNHKLNDKQIINELNQISSLTPKDIKRVINTHLVKDNFQYLVIGDQKKLTPILNNYGKIMQVKASEIKQRIL